LKNGTCRRNTDAYGMVGGKGKDTAGSEMNRGSTTLG